MGTFYCKVSKIENGKQTPTDDDIRAWTRATNSEGETEGLLASLHTLEVQHAEWQRVLKAGMLSHQLELSEQDERTKLYRAFEPAAIPGLPQTPEYARARFSQVVMVHKVPNDINEAVEQRMLRQGILTSTRVVTSVVLRAGDLDRALVNQYPELACVREFHEQYRHVVHRATEGGGS